MGVADASAPKLGVAFVQEGMTSAPSSSWNGRGVVPFCAGSRKSTRQGALVVPAGATTIDETYASHFASAPPSASNGDRISRPACQIAVSAPQRGDASDLKLEFG